MDNVPSAALLAVIAIVAACIIGGFVFSTVSSQKDAGNSAMGQVDEMNVALLESDYTQYDGIEVTGSQVINIIKKFKNDKICITVDNGRGATEYIYNSSLSSESTAEVKDATDKANLSTYINKTSQFLGEVIRDDSTETITGITFTKQ